MRYLYLINERKLKGVSISTSLINWLLCVDYKRTKDNSNVIENIVLKKKLR